MSNKKILTKLNIIRNKIKVDKEGSRYKAFTIAKLNAELNPLLEEHKVGVSFSVQECNIKPVEKANGNYAFVIHGTCKYEIHDLESDDSIEVITGFTGMNSEGDPSKSQGNAHSYSYKYLWVTLLGLTDEESDVDSPINQNNAMLQEQISNANPISKDESKALYKGYEEGFSTCTTKEQVEELIEEARVDVKDMLNYEKQKLKKLVETTKEKWGIE
jgi:hypothetical protein